MKKISTLRNLEDLVEGQNQNVRDLLVRRMGSSEADRLKIKFFKKTKKANNNECWEWLGPKHNAGYGYVYFTAYKGFQMHILAHRYSMIIHGHIIPKGMFIDHMCRNRACVNPSHLRIVSPSTNALENSMSHPAKNIAKTHCIRGHLLSGYNASIYINKIGRSTRKCRACDHLKYLKTKKKTGKGGK